ncbi:glycoside hydrolase family 57 protein [Dysgonomonas sp. GY617]|uniref:glycoside hydrolase family 57 protein n=1 Tax=Dysgonomonas sp. GY617 TaxID=2780420 RepID=UPI001883C8B2|nr:glycoside hydrolase family 57 protein [Dysgonomonas sp. GY617]MBF0575229.1 polysaccharide deacetylase family protein [Dysgonomonas sp. GY617]
MKKTLCFYFQIHLPFQLRRYRFFDIGNSHQYYDEFNIRNYLNKIVEQCYLPMNKVLLDIIKEHGSKFKVAFSITGETIEQLEQYAPQVLDSFKELAATGSVEFICETYAHSLAFLKDEKELERQLKKQAATIKKYFNQEPVTARLTGLMYSDQIGERVANLGFKAIVTEGAKHVLGWKSPNYVYSNVNNPDLNVLLRNFHLSDDIAYRFSDRSWSEWPVTSEKFVNWLDVVNENEEVVNLFMDYITFGNRHSRATGIFEFMRYLPKEVFSHDKFEFLTPSEVIKKHKPVGPVHVPYPISWSEEERDLSIWLGNDLQNDAFTSLCDLGEKVRFVDDASLTQDWERLQDSDHYYYMCTKWMSDAASRRFKSVYSSPYDAYINYMNVLSDLISRVNEAVAEKVDLLMKDSHYANEISKFVTPHETEYSSLQIKKIVELLGQKAGKSLLESN